MFNKYYQKKNKKKLQKEARHRYQNISEEKKRKKGWSDCNWTRTQNHFSSQMVECSFKN